MVASTLLLTPDLSLSMRLSRAISSLEVFAPHVFRCVVLELSSSVHSWKVFKWTNHDKKQWTYGKNIASIPHLISQSLHFPEDNEQFVFTPCHLSFCMAILITS